MSWTDCLGNRQAIDAIYSTTPSLHDIRLHEVSLHQDGARVSLRFDLPTYPEQAPRKWTEHQFNRVQLTLVFIGLSDFEMRGWSENNIGNLELAKNDVNIGLKFVGDTTVIECYAQFVEVEKLSGYHDSAFRDS